MTFGGTDEIRAGLCPLCLRPRDAEGGCSVCGWNGDVIRSRPNCLSPGTVLRDRYLVGQPLGQGGFSITYLVLDLSLNLRLCLKEFFPASAVSRNPGVQSIRVNDARMEEPFREGLEQFVFEGRVLARLSGKPGIIEVRDLFQLNGTAYMVTDLLEGVTLRDYLAGRKSPLSPSQVLKILMPVMDSLREVHDEGILHCDISPENVFLTTDGKVRLLDFGSALDLSLKLAQGRSIVVKPGYAAPEQYRARGRQGPWTDVYGLAATFYRALAGKAPPDALDRLEDDPLRTLFQQIRPQLSGKWKKALLRGMAVQVGDRFQDVASFQYALSEAAGLGEEVKSEAVRKSSGRFFKVLAAAMCLACLVAGGLWQLNRRPESLLARASRVLHGGEPDRAVTLLQSVESGLGRMADPAPELVLALCRGYSAAGEDDKALNVVLQFPGPFSSTPEGLSCAALVFERTDRIETALGFASRATALAPGIEEYWLTEGRIARALGLPGQALNAFLMAADVAPADPFPRFAAARLLAAQFRYDESEAMYVRALTLDPENGESWAELALLRERRSNPAEAVRAWNRAVRLIEDNPEYWRHLARSSSLIGDQGAAADAWLRVTELDEGDPASWVELGRTLAYLDSAEKALDAFDHGVGLGAASEDVGVLIERAEVALRLGKTQRGVADLETALDRDPSREKVWSRLARIYESLGDYDRAVRTWRAALPHVESQGEIFQALGQALRLVSRPVEAEEAFRRARFLLGEREEVLMGLAGSLLDQARFTEALPVLRRALEIRADSPLANLLMGEVLLGEGNAEAALPYLLKASEMGDQSVRLHLDLGRGYLDIEQFSLAADCFRRVLQDEPDNGKAIRLLEETFYRWGRQSGSHETEEGRADRPVGEKKVSSSLEERNS